MLKIKKEVDLNVLKKYGFELGINFVNRGETCICNKSDYQDYWKFSMQEDEPEKVLYADEEFDQAAVSIHIQSDFENRLWIECVPSSSYHIEGWDLDIISDTLLAMANDGIIEVVKDIE